MKTFLGEVRKQHSICSQYYSICC